jgi:hypothetical protein
MLPSLTLLKTNRRGTQFLGSSPQGILEVVGEYQGCFSKCFNFSPTSINDEFRRILFFFIVVFNIFNNNDFLKCYSLKIILFFNIITLK